MPIEIGFVAMGSRTALFASCAAHPATDWIVVSLT
jgi:hypothetical protein